MHIEHGDCYKDIFTTLGVVAPGFPHARILMLRAWPGSPPATGSAGELAADSFQSSARSRDTIFIAQDESRGASTDHRVIAHTDIAGLAGHTRYLRRVADWSCGWCVTRVHRTQGVVKYPARCSSRSGRESITDTVEIGDR